MGLISNLYNWYERVIRQVTTIPYACVPHEPDTFLKSHPKFKLVKKYLHRQLLLWMFGQMRLEKTLPLEGRFIWIYTAKRNFGDAVMDLSGRALLKDKVKNNEILVDLFTLPHLKKVFEEDDIFGKVISDVAEINFNAYTHVILSETNPRSIKWKAKLFKKLPFVSLFKYFDGPDRNQTLFSFASINQEFHLGLSQEEITHLAKPYLASSASTMESVTGIVSDDPFITVGVGGIDEDRTYKKWIDFFKLLDESSFELPRTIVLLGAANGLEDVEKILSQSFSHLKIISYVNQLSLLQSREVIQRSVLYIGCDGGLMHVAHTTSSPTISLFSKEPSYLRLTEQCHSTPLQSINNVNLIDATQIMDLVIQRLNTFKH